MNALLTVLFYIVVAVIIAAVIVALFNAFGIGEPWRTIAIALVALAAVVASARKFGVA